MEKQEKKLEITTREKYVPIAEKQENRGKHRTEIVYDNVKSSEMAQFTAYPQNTATYALPHLRSFEKLSLARLKVLYLFLLDTLETKDFGSSESGQEEKKWYMTNCRRVEKLLEGADGYCFCSTTHLYREVYYQQKYTKSNLHVGRLMSEHDLSLLRMPREIRGILVSKRDYIDLDIVNSHPSLLLEYVHAYMPTYNPKLLSKYVHNRDKMLAEKSEIDGCSPGEAKRELLAAMNTQLHYKKTQTFGVFSVELLKEILPIRDSIYHTFFRKGSSIYRYYENNEQFKRKKLNEQKVSVQSIYLQSKETDYVIGYINHLRETINSLVLSGEHCLREFGGNSGFEGKLLDRKVTIHLSHYYVSFVPFYDGFYVGSESVKMLQEISKTVSPYNKSLEEDGSLIRFKEKSIERKWKRIDGDFFELYYRISKLLDSLNTRQFHELLRLLKIKPLTFEGCHSSTPEEKRIVNGKKRSHSVSDMLNRTREFRRTICQKVMAEHTDRNIPLEENNFLAELRKRYQKDLSEHNERSMVHNNDIISGDPDFNVPDNTNLNVPDD